MMEFYRIASLLSNKWDVSRISPKRGTDIELKETAGMVGMVDN